MATFTHLVSGNSLGIWKLAPPGPPQDPLCGRDVPKTQGWREWALEMKRNIDRNAAPVGHCAHLSYGQAPEGVPARGVFELSDQVLFLCGVPKDHYAIPAGCLGPAHTSTPTASRCDAVSSRM